MTDGTQKQWLDVPPYVAQLLGRFTYYASWLDDTLGEAVVIGNPHATEHAESTPGWARSGSQLVDAVLAIAPDQPVMQDIARRLGNLNVIRNQLVHGVWLWEDEKVMVMKRQLGKGQRSIAYATYTYVEIEGFIRNYQQLGGIADKLVEMLTKGNSSGVALAESQSPTCTIEGDTMLAVVRNDLIVWECPTCRTWRSAVPED